MQNAKYIYNFSKKVVISFGRGDIDVRTSHAKPSLFFALFYVYNVLDILFFAEKPEFSAGHQVQPTPETMQTV